MTWRRQLWDRSLSPALIENLFDLKAVEEGRISADQVRRIELSDARIDTGATFVSMPTHLIEKLGSWTA